MKKLLVVLAVFALVACSSILPGEGDSTVDRLVRAALIAETVNALDADAVADIHEIAGKVLAQRGEFETTLGVSELVSAEIADLNVTPATKALIIELSEITIKDYEDRIIVNGALSEIEKIEQAMKVAQYIFDVTQPSG